MKIEIVPFDLCYSREFRELNIAWLQKFFHVEPLDEEILGNPQKYIIDLGGHIFFARINNEIVGTIAPIKHSEGIFELSKMAVDPKYQGRKIGQKLLEASLEYAKTHNWRTLLLYSNRKLENAIYLYKKFGFKEIEMEKDNPYARGDIKMELLLS
ncbi:MAG TPA: GNAT family N-acetyltransferase [Salinimicrobium sp.]|nr:GNAT family N-acetyltransferase [Salinimicrobium sp.]